MNPIWILMLGLCSIYEVSKVKYEFVLYKRLMLPPPSQPVKFLDHVQMEIMFFYCTGKMLFSLLDLWEILTIASIAIIYPQLSGLMWVLLAGIWFSLIGMYYNPSHKEQIHGVLHSAVAIVFALVSVAYLFLRV